MKQADILHNVCFDPSGFIQLETTQSLTRIWFMGDGIVRIRTTFDGHFPEESISLVWTAWDDHYDSLMEKERRIHPR